MRILITGGAGFIGSHIVEYFSGNADVIVLDNLSTGQIENISDFEFKLIEGDIRDESIVESALKNVDVVFHLAALVSVPGSMDDPLRCVDVNVNGLLNILRGSANAGVKKFIFSSSCSVYGNNPTIPKKENMLPEPESPYAVSKIDGEFYSHIFSGNNDMKTVCLRYFNVFGPRQNPNSTYAAVVPSFIVNALAGNNLNIYGDGEQTRDFVFVKDVARANVFAMENDIDGIFNVANGCRISVNELAKTIIAITNSASQVNHLAVRSGDVKHSVACTEKISTAGFQPSYSFERGLTETVDYYTSL